VLVPSINGLAVALFDSNKQQSRIVLIDATSGTAGVKPASANDTKLISKIDGCIMSLCSPSAETSGWDDNSTSSKTVDLFALTSKGRLLKFTDAVDDSTPTLLHTLGDVDSSGPRLEIERGDSTSFNTYYNTQPNGSRETKTAIEMFGITRAEDGTASHPLSSELPTLNNDFVGAFVRRNLR